MAEASLAFTPIQIGPVTLRNRFIRAGANEGMTPAGLPTKALVEHHRAMARGGVGMTTMAYGAVSRDGLTFPHQCVIDRQSLPHLRVLTNAVHAEGAAACLQITHAGAFTQMKPSRGRPISASGGFNAAGLLFGMPLKRAMTPTDMAEITQQFIAATAIAAEAGFDAVEIHMGHGYLLNQFTSPLDNHRTDHYGGSAENRARFPAELLRAVKSAHGKHLAICAKINTTDGAPGGATATDVAVLAQMLEDAGADLLTLSGGRNVESPWALFSGKMPVDDLMQYAQGFVQKLAFRTLKMRQPAEVPFRELYFLQEALAVREAVRMNLSLVGGVKSRNAVDRAMSAGFNCVSLARVLLHDPAFVNKLRDGIIDESGCTSCNRCVASIYAHGGTACVIGPPNDATLTQVLAC